jgi:hypothetical protein
MNDETPLTITVPEAGKKYFDLSRDASYAAAQRGDIPTIRVGRLLRVPVVAMERKLEEAGNWRQLGDIAQCVVESCGADVRDTQRRMQAELDRQNKKGE